MAHKIARIDPRWLLPLLLVVGLLALGWFKLVKPVAPPGCFTFQDGTVQWWSLDQLYDSYSNPPRRVLFHVLSPPGTTIPYTPFQLSNHGSSELEAAAMSILVTDPKAKDVDIYLNSPDLSMSKGWQGSEGYELDIKRTLAMICKTPVPPKRYKAQFQLVVVDKATGNRHVVAQVDNSGKFLFHTISNASGQHILWKWGKHLTLGGRSLPVSDIKIERVRIRLTMPGYPETAECLYGGAWRIDDVCPVR